MRVLLSGGGTGGHIYPALALQKRIKELYPDAEFLYVGTERGLESRIVPQAGLAFESVEIQGLRRSLSMENLRTLYLMLTSIHKSKRIVKNFQPDVVIGTGGYVCAPVLYAASRLGVPTIIHEQNSVAGVTNKFLARFVDRICICFEDARADFAKQAQKVVLTGNPRAQEVVANTEKASLAEYGLRDDQPTVLVFGGSRGAAKINRSTVDALGKFKGKPYQVILVTGNEHYDNISAQAKSVLGEAANVKVLPYVQEMPSLFRAIDVVACRSGATTLTELTALGLPSILIPSPYVTNDHQRKNAESLEKVGAAMVILEKDLDAQHLYESIDSLLQDEGKRQEMAVKARTLGIPDAADRIVTLIDELVSHK